MEWKVVKVRIDPDDWPALKEIAREETEKRGYSVSVAHLFRWGLALWVRNRDS